MLSKAMLLLSKAMVLKYMKGLKDRRLTIPACCLVYNAIPVGMCIALGFNITFTLVSNPEPSSCYASVPDTKPTNSLVISLIQTCLYFVLYPILGWLTDTYINRQRAMKMSIVLCWLGSLLQVVSYCIQYGTCGLPTSFAKYGISLIALICLMIGTACYQVNILVYGLDQLFEKANSHVRSFIHWMVWAQFIGFLVSYIAFVNDTVYQGELLIITGLIVFIACTFAVFFDKAISHKFQPSPKLLQCNNPYKLVLRVLLYAKRHKTPQNRSALTYWENSIPSRISLGKSKYGGPFTEDEIENVKTFFKMVVVLVSTFGFFIPNYLLVNGVLPFVNVFSGATTDADGFGSFILWNCFNKIIIFVVPILELIILPLLPKLEYFFLSPHLWFGIACVLMLLTLLSMIVIDTVGYFVTSNEPPFCFLTTSGITLNISYFYYSIPLLLGSLANMIGTISILEFICSQAPINMSGMLTGCFYLIRGIYVAIGPYLQLPFSYVSSTEVGRITCSFWIILINIIICVVGLTVYVLIYRWYTNRKRGEEYNTNVTVEGVYDNYLISYVSVQDSSEIIQVVSIDDIIQ